MVRIGTVWDEAVDATRGRARMILPIAAAALFFPSVVQTAVASYGAQPGQSAAATGALGLLTIPLMVVTLWGALAITAITSHHDVTAGEAGRRAGARLPPLIGVWVVLGLAAGALFLPFVALLAASGVDLQAIAEPGYRPAIGAGLGLAAALYALAALGLLLWLLARLLPLVPVVLNERLGLGAIGRSFRLTRGMGGRLFGLLVLYFVVLVIASSALTAVVGLVFRLLLGGDAAATAAFLGGVAGAVVSTALSVLSYAFVSRLYAALTGSDLRAVFEDDPVRA